MLALQFARRACPPQWFRGAGIVNSIEARALQLIAQVNDGLAAQEPEWVAAARAVGRAVGGAGSDVKKRKHHLAFALADYLTRCEPKAALVVRQAIWEEGMHT